MNTRNAAAVALAWVVAALGACQGQPKARAGMQPASGAAVATPAETVAVSDPVSRRSAALVNDQSNGGGNLGFIWIAPMVTTTPGGFTSLDQSGSGALTVRVDRLFPDNTVTSKTTFAGSAVRMVTGTSDAAFPGVTGPFYGVSWAAGSTVAAGEIYRLSVVLTAVPSRTLGVSDVEVVANATAAGQVDRSKRTPLIAGNSLSIVFRLESKDTDGDTVNDWKDNCPRTKTASQLDSNADGVGDACQCLNTPNGTACSTGCRTGQTCQAGACTGGTAVANGTACGTGNACKQNETCTSGTCGGGSNRSNGTTCSTGNPCKQSETCTSGTCGGGSNRSGGTACSTGNPCKQSETCTSGTCGGGSNRSGGTACSTGNPCRQGETCTSGTCGGGANATNGTVCGDRNLCTQADTCQAGVCTGGGAITCAADACHNAGTCDRTLGICPTRKANGTSCNDGNACTSNDTCQSGACAAGAPVVCTTDQCHTVGACVPATGCPAPDEVGDGTDCNDGNACTRVSFCQAGSCQGSDPVRCFDDDACHAAGTCNTTTGVCSNPPLAGSCEIGAFDYDKAGRLVRDRRATLVYDAYDQLREVRPIGAPPSIANLTVEELSVAGSIPSRSGRVSSRGHTPVQLLALTGGAIRTTIWRGAGQPSLDVSAGSPSVIGSGINDQDTVAGTWTAADGTSHAFRYGPGGVFKDLGNPGTATFALAVNASNQVAGYYDTGATSRAYRYTDAGGFEPLVAYALSTWGWNIDDQGVVAGSAQVSTAPATGMARYGRAILFRPNANLDDVNTFIDPQAGVTLVMANEAHGSWVAAQGIRAGKDHAYRVRMSTRTFDELAWAGSTFSVGINAFGDMVGWGYTDAADTLPAAWIKSDRTGFVKLADLVTPNSGWDLRYPTGINDDGDVVGIGLHNGVTVAFRLHIPLRAAVSGAPAVAEAHTYGHDGLRTSTTLAPGTSTAKTQFWFARDYTEHDGQRDHYLRVGDHIVAKVVFKPAAGSAAVTAASLSRASAEPGTGSGRPEPVTRWAALLLVLCGAGAAAAVAARRRRSVWAAAAAAAPLMLVLAASCGILGSSRQAAVTLWQRTDTVYFHQGLAAGPAITTGAGGTLKEERRYEPFGQPIDANLAGVTAPVDFTREPQNSLGKMTDANSGLSDHGARWMQPQSARWVSPDPAVRGPDPKFLLSPWDLNPYQYVSQNPNVAWDPDGRDGREGTSGSTGNNPGDAALRDLDDRIEDWDKRQGVNDRRLAESELARRPHDNSVWATGPNHIAAAMPALDGHMDFTHYQLMADFGPLLLEAPAAIAGRLAFRAASFRAYMNLAEGLDVASGRSAAIFYSGKGNRQIAEGLARRMGKTTLEMTPGGKWLDSMGLFRKGSRLNTKQALSVWGRVSERYAGEASGCAIAICQGARFQSVFNTREFPMLLKNPAVTNVVSGGF